MAIYSAGKILKACREAKKITQEQLCEGICTACALSKIENGHNEPAYVTFASLMERMGEWPESYDCYTGDQSYQIQECEDAVLQLQYQNKFVEAKEKLEKLEELLKGHPRNVIYQQFLKLNKILVETEGYTNRKQLEELEDILRMTVPSFEKKPIDKLFLSHQEIMAINSIAIGRGENGQIESAIKLLRELKAYIEQNFVGIRMKQSAYSTINRNLVKYLGMGGHHREAIREADGLIDRLRELGKTVLVSDLHYSIAWNYIKMDRLKYSKKIEDEILLSLYADISCRNFENAEETIRLVRKNMSELLERPIVLQFLAFYHRLVKEYCPTQTE